MSNGLPLIAGEPRIERIDFSEAHLSEAAVFGGKRRSYPAWLCGLLHKKHFISCWSAAQEWQSHVLCGYCQRCRHFTNDKLRYNWMPSDRKPHRFHVRVWPDGTSQIEVNELYLHEVFNLIETLAVDERELTELDGVGELDLIMESTDGGHSYKWCVFALDRRARLRVLSHLFIIYRHALDGTGSLPAEQRWWYKLPL